MMLPPSQKDRAHNLRIVGTISNDIETLNLDWLPLESKLLAAAAYVAPRRILYLRFNSGEVYRYFLFPADQYQQFLEVEEAYTAEHGVLNFGRTVVADWDRWIEAPECTHVPWPEIQAMMRRDSPAESGCERKSVVAALWSLEPR